MIAIALPLPTGTQLSGSPMRAIQRRSGSRVGSSSPASFPCHCLDLEIGANLFANRSLIEISWHLYCLVEVEHPLGLLQWYAAILDNLADGHGIGAVWWLECHVRGNAVPGNGDLSNSGVGSNPVDERVYLGHSMSSF